MQSKTKQDKKKKYQGGFFPDNVTMSNQPWICDTSCLPYGMLEFLLIYCQLEKTIMPLVKKLTLGE